MVAYGMMRRNWTSLSVTFLFIPQGKMKKRIILLSNLTIIILYFILFILFKINVKYLIYLAAIGIIPCIMSWVGIFKSHLLNLPLFYFIFLSIFSFDTTHQKIPLLIKAIYFIVLILGNYFFSYFIKKGNKRMFAANALVISIFTLFGFFYLYLSSIIGKILIFVVIINIIMIIFRKETPLIPEDLSIFVK